MAVGPGKGILAVELCPAGLSEWREQSECGWL